MHYDAGVVEHAANQGSLMAGTTESQKVESKTANARRVDYHLAAAKVLERSSFRALSRGTIRLQSIITAARSVAPDQRPVCDSSAISLSPSASTWRHSAWEATALSPHSSADSCLDP